MSQSTGYKPVHGGYPGVVPEPVKRVEGLQVTPEGRVHHVFLPTDAGDHLYTLQGLVGGPIEWVSVKGVPDVHAYCNEDGIALDLLPNLRATALCFGTMGLEARGRLLRGNVVFFGSDEEGNEASLPMHWLKSF